MDPKVLNCLLEAGKIALSEQAKLVNSIKSDGSLVTNGDLEVSNFLTSELFKLFPDFETFSEESANLKPSGNKIIVLDPIDGTQSYSRKQDSWCILMGFIENGKTTRGYVYQPTKNLIYFCEEDAAFVKDLSTGLISPIVSSSVKLNKALSSPTRAGETEFLKKMGYVDIENMYSASLKIMEIAKGNFDIYPNFQKKCSLWDLVAPELILNSAGGKIIYENPTTLNFQDPRINTRFCAISSGLKGFSF